VKAKPPFPAYRGRNSSADGRREACMRGRALPIDKLERGDRTVKRTVGLLAGLAALGVGGYVGSRLGGQTPSTPRPRQAAAPAQIRIALINFPQVIQSYQKFKLYQDELKKVVDGYQKQDDQLRDQMLKGKTILEDTKNPPAAQVREQWEAHLTN